MNGVSTLTGQVSTGANILMPDGYGIDSATTGSTLNLGTTTATTINIGGTQAVTKVLGLLKVPASYGLDTATAGTLNIGTTTANAITMGSANASTTVKGDLQINGYATTTASSGNIATKGTMTAGGSLVLTAATQPDLLQASGVRTMVGMTIPRWAATGAGSLPGLNTMWMMPVVLYAGNNVTNVSFSTTGTGITNPSHWWFAIYDSNLALKAQTADQTSTAWASNTLKRLALVSPLSITTTSVYYVAVYIEGFTGPTLLAAPVMGSAAVQNVGYASYDSTGGYGGTAPNPAIRSAATGIVFWAELD